MESSKVHRTMKLNSKQKQRQYMARYMQSYRKRQKEKIELALLAKLKRMGLLKLEKQK